MNRKLIF